MDTELLVTIGLIFLLTSIGGYLHARLRDRCLKSFDGFHVTLVKSDGRTVWGRLHLVSGGMEIAYPSSSREDSAPKTSFLLHGSELPHIQTLFRYADNLDDAERRKRESDIATSFHPGPLRRAARWARNAFGSATDALREVITLVVGRTSQAYTAEEGRDTLTKLGGNVLTGAGGAYEPLLERQIGHHVVVEVMEGDEVHEHVGLFKEYSADFLQLLDVQYPWHRALEVEPDRTVEIDCVSAAHGRRAMKVTNDGEQPILVLSVTFGDREREVNAIVDAGRSIDLPLDGAENTLVKVNVQTIRELDLIAPRTRAVVRHRAEPIVSDTIVESMADLVFDLGTLVRGGEARDLLEAKLRRELAEASDDPIAAASLGGLLVKKHEFEEAEKWLRKSLASEGSLPDGGRRVRMHLRELARKRGQRSPAGRVRHPGSRERS